MNKVVETALQRPGLRIVAVSAIVHFQIEHGWSWLQVVGAFFAMAVVDEVAELVARRMRCRAERAQQQRLGMTA